MSADEAVTQSVNGQAKAFIRSQIRGAQVLAFLKKLPPCVAGIEACGFSHHLARELNAVEHGSRSCRWPTLSGEAIYETLRRPNAQIGCGNRLRRCATLQLEKKQIASLGCGKGKAPPYHGAHPFRSE
jgi:hypothetical protein